MIFGSKIEKHLKKFQKKLKKQKLSRRQLVLAVIGLLLVLVGVYLLFLTQIPKRSWADPAKSDEVKQLETQKTDEIPAGYHVVIPSIGVNAEIINGEVENLKGNQVLHRFPDRGDPVSGGNFILVGHRFIVHYNPNWVKEASVFYNLPETKIGDPVFIYWNRQKFEYKIVKSYAVEPHQIAVEFKSSKPKLTIYTCTQLGADDGRIVIEALPKWFSCEGKV